MIWIEEEKLRELERLLQANEAVEPALSHKEAVGLVLATRSAQNRLREAISLLGFARNHLESGWLLRRVGEYLDTHAPGCPCNQCKATRTPTPR